MYGLLEILRLKRSNHWTWFSAGNMRHLIVESCIARNLLDTSAYLWLGYANGCINQIPQCVPAQVPGWSSFMNGAPLTPAMINALVSSPASRYNLSNLYMKLFRGIIKIDNLSVQEFWLKWHFPWRPYVLVRSLPYPFFLSSLLRPCISSVTIKKDNLKVLCT